MHIQIYLKCVLKIINYLFDELLSVLEYILNPCPLLFVISKIIIHFFFLGINYDEVLKIGRSFQQIYLFEVMKINFSYKYVLNIKAESFLFTVCVFLRKLLFIVFKLWDVDQEVTDVFNHHHFVEVHVFELALDNKHALVILEVEVVVGLEGHQLTNFYPAAHSFGKLLLFSDDCLVPVEILPNLHYHAVVVFTMQIHI